MANINNFGSYLKKSIETLITCFEGTKNILELAKYHRCKVLFTSTSEIYGDPIIHPQPEHYFGNVNTVGERSCYDEGKRVAETLMYEYRKKFNLDLKKNLRHDVNVHVSPTRSGKHDAGNNWRSTTLAKKIEDSN